MARILALTIGLFGGIKSKTTIPKWVKTNNLGLPSIKNKQGLCMVDFAVITFKNEYGKNIDKIQNEIFKKYKRFYGDNGKDYNFALAVSTMSGGFSTFFLGFDTKAEMKKAIGDIAVKSKCGYRNETDKFVETYNENEPGLSYLYLHPTENFPIIAFGKGTEFEKARQKNALYLENY